MEGDAPFGVRVIATVDTMNWIEVCSTFRDFCVGVLGHGTTGLPDLLWFWDAGVMRTLECLGC